MGSYKDRLAAKIAAAAALVALLGPALVSAHEQSLRDELVVRWNSQLLQAVRDTSPAPPVVSRMLAVVHTCMYDAWAAYDDKAHGTMYADRLRRPARERTRYNKRAAIAHAALLAAVDLLPSQRAQFEKLVTELGFDPNDKHSLPAQVGRHACRAVLRHRHADGSNQLGNLSPGAYSDYSGYRAANTAGSLAQPGRWQPLEVRNASGAYVTQKFALPHWGRVRPFAIDVRRIQVKPPARYGSRAFLEQAREVVSYSAGLSDMHKCIAEYWSDGPRSETPPGHWNVLAQFVSARDRHNLENDIKLFFILNNALLDAGIEAWWIKRQFDYVRPITAVRHLFSGKMIDAWPGPHGTNRSIRADDWHPYQSATFVTPPFAEYVSGHSTFSAASAEVLKLFTGSDVFGYSVEIERGASQIQPHLVPASKMLLSWATFTDAADEAGLSRRYGGIHFRDGDLEGRRIGRLVGQVVWDKATRLFNPRRPHGQGGEASAAAGLEVPEG